MTWEIYQAISSSGFTAMELCAECYGRPDYVASEQLAILCKLGQSVPQVLDAFTPAIYNKV